ncbi:hypothetical protein [Terasakiella pusilla]|uniref:hypothetical protein n=1 Tax=Terasakiella pusilla TaxID=64973 RepID=UPI003AA80205
MDLSLEVEKVRIKFIKGVVMTMKLKKMSTDKIGGLCLAVAVVIFSYTDTHASEQSISISGGTGDQLSIETLENNTSGGVSHQNTSQIPGKANDIAVDLKGNRYAVGSQKIIGGYALYKWPAGANAWQKMTGAAVRVSARPDETWIVNEKGEVFFESRGRWTKVPSPVAKDIGGGRSAVWITGQNGEIFRYVSSREPEFQQDEKFRKQLAALSELGGWQRVHGSAMKITVDESDNPWIIDNTGQLKRLRNGQWVSINAPKAIDLDSSKPGSVQFVGEKGEVFQFEVGGRWWIASSSTDTVAIGGGGGELLRVNRNLDIFKVF